MPKASVIQGNFNTGEISPLVYGRVDSDRYKSAMTTCLNFVPTVQGGLTRRPGTMFIGEVKDSSTKIRLIPFKFSETEAYVLEFGPLYIRFYRDYGLVLDSSNNPYEVVTTFTEDELEGINFNQSADVVYLVHPNHVPKKLSRFGDIAWTLEEIDFPNGPFDFDWYSDSFSVSANTGAAVLTGTSSAVFPPGSDDIVAITNNNGEFQVEVGNNPGVWETIKKINVTYTVGTASAQGNWPVEYLGENKFLLKGSTYSGSFGGSDAATIIDIPFIPDDVGKYIKLQQAGSPARIAKIGSFVDEFNVNVLIQGTLSGMTNLQGYFPLFFEGNGPTAVCFFEDRLFFTGTPSAPQRIDGSSTGDYENFKTTEDDGSVVATNAVSFVLNSTEINNGKWLFSEEKGLLCGTLSSEWVIKSASSQEAISPTSITAKQTSSLGSSDCYPVQANKAVLFVQKSGRKVREFHYFYDVDGFRATDMSILADHITATGIKELTYQKDTQSIIWAAKNDGNLIALTYERDIDNLRAGWHRHELGGGGKVESLTAIPSPDGLRDDVWLVVERFIDGQFVKYIEYITKFFEDDTPQKDAFFVDCGLTYDNPLTVTNVTAANPVVVSITSHGLSNGDTLVLSDIEGPTNLNDKIYTVANKTTHTFELAGIDGSGNDPYERGGKVRKRITNISGLGHLEGETVTVLTDGATQSDKVVTAGAITLTNPAGLVHVGLKYNSDGQLPRLDAGAADGTSIGKTRRTNRVGFMFHRSLNLLIGTSFDKMDRMIFRSGLDYLGTSPGLYSGIRSESIEADYDFENQIAFRQDQPFPTTILAIMPQLVTQDR